MTEHNVDTFEFSFTSDDIKAAAERELLGEGLYRWLVMGAEKRISKGNPEEGKPQRPMLVLRVVPMRDPDDVASAELKFGQWQYVVLPQAASEVEDEEAEARTRKVIANLCVRNIRALLGSDEIPYMPQRDGAQWYFKGKKIARDEIEEKKEEVIASGYEAMQRCWNDPTELENTAFYARVTHEDFNGTTQARVGFMMENAPKGEPLQDF